MIDRYSVLAIKREIENSSPSSFSCQNIENFRTRLASRNMNSSRFYISMRMVTQMNKQVPCQAKSPSSMGNI